MMLSHFLYSLILLGSVVIGTLSADDTYVDVCIIGGGPSGVQAAYSAKEAGYTVVIFEKEDRIGGKTKTILDPSGFRQRMGALFSDEIMPFSLQELYDKFQIDYERPLRVRENRFAYQTQDIMQYNVSKDLKQEARYFLLRKVLGYAIDYPNAMANHAYPPLLDRLSAAQWMKKRKVTILKDNMWRYFTSYGYGLGKSIPAIYLVKYFYMNEKYLGEPMSPTNLFFEDLLLAMVNSLNCTLHLNARILTVEYPLERNITKISFLHGVSTLEQQIGCGATIIAFPQLTKRMEKFIPPGTIGSKLISLTDQVQTMRYATALFDGTNQFTHSKTEGTLFHSTPNAQLLDENIAYQRQYPNQTSSVVAYYLAPDPSISVEELKTNMFLSYKKFVNDSSLDPETTLQAFCDWEYFPHVNSTSLEKGFYKEFYNIQGQANQYYTGGLFNFEMVQNSMAHGKFIIQQFFPPK